MKSGWAAHSSPRSRALAQVPYWQVSMAGTDAVRTGCLSSFGIWREYHGLFPIPERGRILFCAPLILLRAGVKVQRGCKTLDNTNDTSTSSLSENPSGAHEAAVVFPPRDPVPGARQYATLPHAVFCLHHK